VAAQHVAAVVPEHRADAARDLSLHGVEDHVDALRVGQRPYAFDHIDGLMVDYLGTQRFAEGHLLCAADHGDDASPMSDGELHDGRPDAAAGAQHDDGLAGRDSPSPDRRVVRGVTGDEEPGCIHITHAVRYLEDGRHPDRHRGQASPRLDAHGGDALSKEVAPAGRGVDDRPHALLSDDVGAPDRDGVGAARGRDVGQRQGGVRHGEHDPIGERLPPRGHRLPAAEAHGHAREVNPRRLGHFLEHIARLTKLMYAPGLHFSRDSTATS
jgi:hypothetical protein